MQNFPYVPQNNRQNNCSFKILLLFLKEKKTDLCELLFSERKRKIELARTVILS